MIKSLVVALFIILVTDPVYGYTITMKEKLIGILQKTTVIRNVKFIEIDEGYVHVELKEKGYRYPYSFQCNLVVQIMDDNGEDIPFDCDNSSGGASSQLGLSEIERKDKHTISELNQDIRSAEISQIQDAMILEGSSQRMEITKRNIKIEENVVIIEVTCRRTNIHYTLIKS